MRAMPKPVVIDGRPPKGHDTVMMLMPIGTYCNALIQKAENDSVIEFRDAWRRDKYILLRKCRVPVNSGVFEFLMKSIYGEGMRWKDLLKQWEAWAVVEGIGKRGFSDSEVLLVEVTPYYEEEYKVRKARKRQIEEMQIRHWEEQAKKEEQAHLLRLAKRGVYKHEDLLP